MCGIELFDCGAAMRALREEIHRLSEQQIAAQKKAALTGMTPDEAQEYKLRHSRIRKLTEDLAVLAKSSTPQRNIMSHRKRRKLRGRVEKLIRPAVPREPEKAQIGVDEADDLYREIRIENVLTGEDGEQVRLKPGAEVDVVLEADSDATTKKPD